MIALIHSFTFRLELDELQARVAVERERYQQNTQHETGLSAVPMFPVNERFSLSKEDAAYTLSIELQIPVDYVLLQVCITNCW